MATRARRLEGCLAFRTLAALLVLMLTTAPALAAICGVDCGRAGAGDHSHDGEAHLHEPAVEHAHADHGEPAVAHADHGHDAPASPHDCHSSGGATDLDSIGAGPQSCTHLRFDAEPARLGAVDAPASGCDVSLVETPAPRSALTPEASPWRGPAGNSRPCQALTLPLRI